VASVAFNDGSYHAVALDRPAPAASQIVTLDSAWKDWKAANCIDALDNRTTVPLVLVSSAGGGIRAAYWTSSVLTDLLAAGAEPVNDCAKPATTAGVFAMSGISGGALGIVSYVSDDRRRTRGPNADPSWYERQLRDPDFASVVVSWGLLADLPRTFIGFRPPDRAEQLEEAWERAMPELGADYFAGSTAPLLLLGGTQVETGCRVNVSRMRLTVAEGGGNDCSVLTGRPAYDRYINDGGRPAEFRVPSAAGTAEIVDYLCAGSIHRSTAALLAARFPYVTPSGRLARCGANDRFTAVVDGGYADNTGIQALLNLWTRLRPAVSAHNATGKGAIVVPVFVEIDNHYASPTRIAPPARTRELLLPPATRGRPDQLDDRMLEQTANAAFSGYLPGKPGWTCQVGDGDGQRWVRIAPPSSPGIPAPLAWTLSRMAAQDLDGQRADAMDDGPVDTLRQAISGKRKLRCAP
jgi:hypothetical protein